MTTLVPFIVRRLHRRFVDYSLVLARIHSCPILLRGTLADEVIRVPCSFSRSRGYCPRYDVNFFLQSAGEDLEVNGFIVLIQVFEADSPCSRLPGCLHEGLLQHLVQGNKRHATILKIDSLTVLGWSPEPPSCLYSVFFLGFRGMLIHFPSHPLPQSWQHVSLGLSA